MKFSLSRRLSYVVLAALTIALGLLVHLYSQALLPPMARDVVGDALYAIMIAWWIGFVAPGASLLHRSVAALTICVSVELSQLYHAPAIDALRATLLGHLVLGSSFDWRDLGVYTAGTLAAVLAERALRRHEVTPVGTVRSSSAE